MPRHRRLVADIGGTNTRVALARGTRCGSGHASAASATPTIPDLPRGAGRYPGTPDTAPAAACVAMAGPVRDGVGTLTNLDWTVDRDVVAAGDRRRRVAILNDLQAQGHALDHLTADNLTGVLPGQSDRPHAAKLVIGVGTGLNAAPVFRLGGQTLVPPSESGHVSLPVQTEEELRLRDC